MCIVPVGDTTGLTSRTPQLQPIGAAESVESKSTEAALAPSPVLLHTQSTACASMLESSTVGKTGVSVSRRADAVQQSTVSLYAASNAALVRRRCVHRI